MLNQKVLLITGGTGSFGHAVLDRFISTEIDEIRIFSRDEKKQDDMRKRYNSHKLKFHLGDVRDKEAVLSATEGVDYVFHAAALKQVPSCEFHPMESVKTNILGTENLLDAAIRNHVKKVVCLSTDKAVYPINAMGISKAMMEKVVIAKSRISRNTKICITRYGNVLASRGSVIPLFAHQVKLNKPITITDPNMTRFMMTLEDAVNLVNFAFKEGDSGDIFVQKAPAASILTIANAMKSILGVTDHPTQIIGTRHGEKLFEVLLSREEMVVAEDMGAYFKIAPDLRDLDYEKFFDLGSEKISFSEDYNSHNTQQLDENSLAEILRNTKSITSLLQQ